MKHLKHHPLNDKQQKLSKDMKKQDLVRPKKDKKLDADDSLSDPTISKRYSKPSNKKLSSEKHLAKDNAVKKLKEEVEIDSAFHPEFAGTDKARKYDELEDKISSFYTEGGDPDLLAIGEYVADFFGFSGKKNRFNHLRVN